MATVNTEHLISHAHELVKQYFVYDGSLRCTHMYTAYTDAIDGAPCQVTEYEYDGSSSRIIKRKEYTDSWDDTWDI